MPFAKYPSWDSFPCHDATADQCYHLAACHHNLTKPHWWQIAKTICVRRTRQNNLRENPRRGVTQPLKQPTKVLARLRAPKPRLLFRPFYQFLAEILPPRTAAGNGHILPFILTLQLRRENHQLDYLVLCRRRHFTACAKPCAGGFPASSAQHLTCLSQPRETTLHAMQKGKKGKKEKDKKTKRKKDKKEKRQQEKKIPPDGETIWTQYSANPLCNLLL